MLKAPGELRPDGDTAHQRLGGAPKRPARTPFVKVATPATPQRKSFDTKASAGLPAERARLMPISILGSGRVP
ncbi:hypothetical protein ADK34_39270 [Streptomyces viridochromogenes]|uniref:Uncharacterized protein n=1 Tax=Streptomyces viridochromogenes TaxID=1938 RepID=A0A0L8J3A0_STRVR|nr:hypothetical protein ADK34_39270 [Streptomyces viridochromogenes]